MAVLLRWSRPLSLALESLLRDWIPAFAGMTLSKGWIAAPPGRLAMTVMGRDFTPAGAGVQVLFVEGLDPGLRRDDVVEGLDRRAARAARDDGGGLGRHPGEGRGPGVVC